MEGREITEGVAKVVQVRDDVEFERHWGGLRAVNWIWWLMQRWRGLENVSQVFGLLNNAINGHRTLQKEAWIWGTLKIKWKQNIWVTNYQALRRSWKWSVWKCESCSVVSDSLWPHGHGILQARVLEWVALPFSRGSSQPRDFFFLLRFFFVFWKWTNFKVFIEFVTMLFRVFFFFPIFWTRACGILAPNQELKVHMAPLPPHPRRWNLNH